MSLIDESTRRRWIELLRGGSYRPTVAPVEAATSLIAHLVGSPLDVSATRVDLSDVADTDEPIPALLPRDWPAQVDRLLDDLGASNALRHEVRTAALALVDGWVLRAVDVGLRAWNQDHRTGEDDD